MNSKDRRISRRQFIKIAGASGAALLVGGGTAGLYWAGMGEKPEASSPYSDSISGRLISSPDKASAPILVLTQQDGARPLAIYQLEILKAEGLPFFQIAELADVSISLLKRFQLVLLPIGAIDQQTAELLVAYVSAGGRLVMILPDADLAEAFSIQHLAGTLSEDYVQFELGQPLTAGFSEAPLQIHAQAGQYRSQDAEVLLSFSDRDGLVSGNPALFYKRVGEGRIAVWAFDFVESIALTRQGNPAWAAQERDERPGIRAVDAFVDWVDLDRIEVPQADMLMRLNSRVMHELLADLIPLPRIWYFPQNAPGVLVATGDSHGNPGSVIDDVLDRVEHYGGHMSVYYKPWVSSNAWRRGIRKARGWTASLPVLHKVMMDSDFPPTPTSIADWRMRGHEFTFHPYVEAGTREGIVEDWEEFTALGYGPVSPTVRTHRVLWDGWVETAKVQAGFDIRMNTDFYHIGPAFRGRDGEWPTGYFNGSGLPMPFIDEQGRVLKSFQQPTHLVDEHLLSGVREWGASGWAGMSAEAAVDLSHHLLDVSRENAHSAICAQFHVDSFALGGSTGDEAGRWLEGTLEGAAERSMPILSAKEWLDFTELRFEANLEGIRWEDEAQTMQFLVATPSNHPSGLTLMVPMVHQEWSLAGISVDGAPAATQERTLVGVRYACFNLPAATSQRVSVRYQ